MSIIKRVRMTVSRELILRFDRPGTIGTMINFLEKEYLLISERCIRRKYCAAGVRIDRTIIFGGKAADVKDTRTGGGAESRARFRGANPRQVSGHGSSSLA